MENMEMSVNLIAVREMSGILLKVRELSGKSCLKLFIVRCIFAFILDFAEFGFGSCTVAFLPPALTITLLQA